MISSWDFISPINDVEFDLNIFNKYFEVHALDETLEHRREEFKTRQEHLQKRKEAFHEREIALKERMLSYEMYVKELAMKRERSIRRMDEEIKLIRNKQIEMKSLENDIEQVQKEKMYFDEILQQYQPHWNLLVQMVDQTDRFQSIDEMIEKFDLLFTSYQDILTTIQQSNQQLDESQRELIIVSEKNKNQITSMNNRKIELEEQNAEVQQRIDRIQIEIENYRRISSEHQTELGAIHIAIDSMAELARKKSPSYRKKHWKTNESLTDKLKRIDIFLHDLIAYVEHVNKRSQASEIAIEHPSNLPASFSTNVINPIRNNRWRYNCEKDQPQIIMKSDISYKVRGDDNAIYTIRINSQKKQVTRKTRIHQPKSLSPIPSSTSFEYH